MSIAKERDEAFKDFVIWDNPTKLKAFCKKYGVPIPEDEKVMAAGVYKAVQYSTGISQEVKDIAFKKCVDLGFSPFIKTLGRGRRWQT